LDNTAIPSFGFAKDNHGHGLLVTSGNDNGDDNSVASMHSGAMNSIHSAVPVFKDSEHRNGTYGPGKIMRKIKDKSF
jgi:hypothetical protein